MPLCIYNIKKSLSIIYTEENPSQGDSPRQFDDAQILVVLVADLVGIDADR